MISIIVPIYNAEDYLRNCLQSLACQTVTDLEFILVDDGSTDSSLDIAKDFASTDPRTTFLVQAHTGQSAARNKGLEVAKGEYIAFVDADDTIAPEWCERHLEAIHGVEYVQSESIRNRYQYTAVWARLYRREAIRKIRFIEGMYYEDVLFSIDLWLSGASCRRIDYHGYHYTLNPSGTTATRHPEDEKKLYNELSKRRKNASLKGKMIILYTVIRLKLHFLCS